MEACYQDFTFSQKAMHCLISCPSFAKNSAMIQTLTESAMVEFRGFENWKPSPTSWSPLRGTVQTKDVKKPRHWMDMIGILDRWSENYEITQERFSEMLQQSQRLRYLALVARCEVHPDEWSCVTDEQHDSLDLQTIRTICRIESLRSLTLDLHGLRFDGYYHGHFCNVIAGLLTTLYSLKIRLPLICADLLSIADDGDKRDLKLEELVINLSISWMPYHRHRLSDSCTEASIEHVSRPPLADRELYQLCDQARVLQARMAKPNRVSILMRTIAFQDDYNDPAWTISDAHARDDWAKKSLDQDFGSEYEDLMQSSTIEAATRELDAS